MLIIVQRCIFGLVFVAALALGCAHLPQSVLPAPSPSPFGSPSPTPSQSSSPSSCASPASNTTAFIVISGDIFPPTPTPSPYGLIYGYVAANPDGSFNDVAQVISVKSTDIVQFVNADTFGPAPIMHSAVGFPAATQFPAVPFTFPASTVAAVGSDISSTQWSTGRIAADCYSQPLTLVPGTFYFGDYDYYNSINMRDVIVVSAARRSALRRQRTNYPHPPDLQQGTKAERRN